MPGNEERGRLHGHEGGIPGRLGLLCVFKCNVGLWTFQSSSSAIREVRELEARESPQLEEDCKNLAPNPSDSLLEGLKAMGRRGLNESSD